MKSVEETSTGRVFESPALEKLSKANPFVSVGVYLAVIIGFMALAITSEAIRSIGEAVVIFIAAYMGWTLFEYLFHRFINHLEDYFPDSKVIEKFDYAIHGIHHEHPRDTSRLIMPPVPGLIIIAILTGLFWLVMGNTVMVFMPGFLLGYLSYAFIHYATHAWKPPRNVYLKSLWRHHALHHYKYPDKAFGVSSPFWDIVFRTMPPNPKEERRRMEEEQQMNQPA